MRRPAVASSKRWSGRKAASARHCGSTRTTAVAGRDMGKKARPGLYQCSELACRRQFTATTKTPFHATKLALRAWLTGFWMQLHSDKGISSVRLAEAVGVTQSTAWRMGHAFRVLMANRETKLGGIVEADDVKIGGKPRKDPANPDARNGMQGHSTKRPALVAVERPRDGRAGQVRAVPVPSLEKEVVAEAMRQIVEPDAHLTTDGGTSFVGLAQESKGADGKPCPPVVAAHDTVTHKQKGVASCTRTRRRPSTTASGAPSSASSTTSARSMSRATSTRRRPRLPARVHRLCEAPHPEGKIVSRPDWRRVQPSSQMANLMAGAVGRQLRSTPEGGLRVLSRSGIVSRAPKSVTMDLSDVDAINF